jgi:N-acetylglutamate synthase-like GNAT family acetyltransferase
MPEMPSKITVRPARGSDIRPLAALIAPFVERKLLLPRTIDELALLLPNYFVAEDTGKLVGCAALEIYSSKLAEVRSLVVVPEYQGHGVGKRLVEACINRAREEQILEVMAITSSEEFFRSCGFDFTLPGEKKALFLQTREA